MNGEHPAASLAPSVNVLRGRAKLAILGLGAVMLARGWDLFARVWSLGLIREIPPEGADDALTARLEHSDVMVNVGIYAVYGAFFLAAVVFLRWLHRLVSLARAFDTGTSWTPSQAMWAWFIPFLSLVRPYQVMSAMHLALEPEMVEPPTMRADPSASSDYRNVAFVQPSPATKLPPAMIGLWWGAFLVMNVGSRIFVSTKAYTTIESVVSAYQGTMFVDAFALVAAALAITVVRGLTARAVERFRRLSESTPEALAYQDIHLRAS